MNMLTHTRVRRDDLNSPTSSPRSSPDPDFTELLRSRAHNEFTFTAAHINTDENNDNAAQDDEEDETELVLFAAPSSAAPQANKIRLESPDAGTGEPGFMVKKPRSYYFADEVTSDKETEYEASAISAETVLSLSRQAWPGCALPWKVRTITPTGLQKSILLPHSGEMFTIEEKVHKRSRKGKKSRIALRKKVRSREEKKVEEERKKAEAEETEREKRTRRNREKKVKKKAREKAKKAAVAGEQADTEENEMD
jgi:hypothetical protein